MEEKYYRIEYKSGICHYVFSWNVTGKEIEEVRQHCIKCNNDLNIDNALVFFQGNKRV